MKWLRAILSTGMCLFGVSAFSILGIECALDGEGVLCCVMMTFAVIDAALLAGMVHDIHHEMDV